MNSFDPTVFLDSSDQSASSVPVRPWSPLQTAVFEALHDPALNVIIQAVAGSGKTTTLIEALRHAPGSALFMAFNKSIAEDIRGKAPKGDVKTLNALGHRLWMSNSSGSKLDGDKVRNLVRATMPADEAREWGGQVQRMVGLAKNSALDIEGSWDDLSILEFMVQLANTNDSLPVGKENDAAIYATKVFLDSRARTDTFDFDDQLYMPLYKGWTYPHYDNVFIDECQDLSPVQHLMLEAFRAGGARVVAVGDRHQAIYGFRGADVQSMNNLKQRFNMLELPLSISYRCCQNVVREAQVYCPTIEWRAGADEGTVSHRDNNHPYEDPYLFDRELVVCRNNAPLFRAILRHVREGSPCRVLSNFIESLQAWIRGFKVDTTRELLARVEKWEEVKVEEAQNSRGRIALIRDKAETVRLLCQGRSLTSDVLRLIKQLGQGSEGPTFATIHKAKGLESDSVFILRPDLVPSPFAESREAKQQEKNLAYVAITRAKHSLTYGVMS